MRNARKRRIQVALVVIILVAAACGNGEAESTTTTASSMTETTAAVTTTETATGDAPDPSGEYNVTHYQNLNDAVTNLWPDSEITLVLAADGTISGNAGCNEYTGTYEVSGPYVEEPGFGEEEGQTFTVSELSWTDMACEDDLIMEQETEYLEAMQNVGRWFFGQVFSDESSIVLYSEEGGLQVEASSSG